MGCRNTCRLCDRFVISNSVTFTGGNLIINLPAGSYQDGCEYCVVVAQAIPAATTIIAPVYFTIGTGTVLYPFNNACCAQMTACALRTRTKYAVRVVTTTTGGSFRLLGKACCSPNNDLLSIDGTAPVAVAAVETVDDGIAVASVTSTTKAKGGSVSA